MRIKAQHNGTAYFPERCPFSGTGDQVFDCEYAALHNPIRCAYEDTLMLHVDPPLNCPLRRMPAAMIIEGVAP